MADQDWFTAALEKTENLHFSMPHVQHIFDTGDSQYRWVVSVARAVEITDGPYTDQGVLLIDLRYNSLEQLFDGMNLAKGGYVYLTDSNGDLIYHPNGQLISSGLAMENNDNTAILRDGNYQEQWQGQTRVVSIKTVGYTGWKIVGVMPLDTVSLNAIKTRILIVFIIALVLFILTIINSYISSRITDPIKELENLSIRSRKEIWKQKFIQVDPTRSSIWENPSRTWQGRSNVLWMILWQNMSPSEKASLIRYSPRSIPISSTIHWISSYG